MGLTWRTALAWRMRRQLLDPAAGGSVADVVRRVGPTPARPDPAMELAVGARRADGGTGDTARALAARELVKVFAFGGALRETLAGGEPTLSELLAALGRRPRYRRVHEAVAGGNWTVVKPLSWQGDLGLGPGATARRRSCGSRTCRAGRASRRSTRPVRP